MNRYSRHIALKSVGISGQKKLTQAKVLVVGAGGLGCPVLQYLAAAGVGTIGIIDGDVVEESNLQRQTLYGKSNLGAYKAEVAKQRLLDINDTIRVDAIPEMLTHKNALFYFANYDIIVDGTDNFTARYLINDAAILTEKPVVYGAIYTFEGQVSVFNYNNGPSYRCLFPNFPNENDIPNCVDVGVLGVVPGIIGCMQANEVLKIILGFENVLSGKLYCYNAKTTQVHILDIKRNEAECSKVIANKKPFQHRHNSFCVIAINDISIEKAFQKKNALFIDVRELNELPEIDELQHLKIPLSNLKQGLHAISKTETLILFCKSGKRSNKAVSMLQTYGIQNCYSLKGGVAAIQNYFKTTVV